MRRELFCKILDAYTSEWIIDSNPPIRGLYKTSKQEATGPRRRTNHKGETLEANVAGGYPQVVRWRTFPSLCPLCCKPVDNRTETINLKSQTVTANCGCKYPIKLDKLGPNSK
jgi:hypothetical protein